jgi:hypothetical protein
VGAKLALAELRSDSTAQARASAMNHRRDLLKFSWSPPDPERVVEAVNRFDGAVVALASEQSMRPTPIGTGVLLRIADSYFVLTAAHTIHQVRTHPIRLGLGGVLASVNGKAAVNQIPDGIDPEHDPIDVGVIRLEGKLPSEPDTLELTLADLDVAVRVSNDTPHVVVGFPVNKSNVVLKRRHAAFKLTRYTGPEVAEPVYSRFGRLKSRHLVLAWDPSTLRRDGIRSSAPALNGVSGGGMWRLDSLSGPYSVGGRDKLVAIFTDHVKNPLGALVGLRVREHLHVIARMWPDTAPQIGSLGL